MKRDSLVKVAPDQEAQVLESTEEEIAGLEEEAVSEEASEVVSEEAEAATEERAKKAATDLMMDRGQGLKVDLMTEDPEVAIEVQGTREETKLRETEADIEVEIEREARGERVDSEAEEVDLEEAPEVDLEEPQEAATATKARGTESRIEECCEHELSEGMRRSLIYT
jgi:hypothetical protein